MNTKKLKRIIVLVVYCCIKSIPKLRSIKNKLVIISVSLNQESKLDLAGCLWLKFSHKAKVKVAAGALISSKCSSGIGSTSTLTYVVLDRIQLLWIVGLTASVPHWLLSELRTPSVLGHMTLTIGQLTINQWEKNRWLIKLCWENLLSISKKHIY